MLLLAAQRSVRWRLYLGLGDRRSNIPMMPKSHREGGQILMCNVTIYRGEKKDECKLWEDVAGYEIQLDQRRVQAWKMMGEKKEFLIENNIRWSAREDYLII